MISLKLNAETDEQAKVKKYLEENASETLAEKINNGVKINKDNKILLNKKDLPDFMSFAQTEARKLLEKGNNVVCVDDQTVYGWAIHYFEEDSIEGVLFNEDGSEYKKPIPKFEPPKIEPSKIEPVKKQDNKISFFDLLQENNSEESEEAEEEVETDEETVEEEVQDPIIDKHTGEVITDKEVADIDLILDHKIEVRL